MPGYHSGGGIQRLSVEGSRALRRYQRFYKKSTQAAEGFSKSMWQFASNTLPLVGILSTITTVGDVDRAAFIDYGFSNWDRFRKLKKGHIYTLDPGKDKKEILEFLGRAYDRTWGAGKKDPFSASAAREIGNQWFDSLRKALSEIEDLASAAYSFGYVGQEGVNLAEGTRRMKAALPKEITKDEMLTSTERTAEIVEQTPIFTLLGDYLQALERYNPIDRIANEVAASKSRGQLSHQESQVREEQIQEETGREKDLAGRRERAQAIKLRKAILMDLGIKEDRVARWLAYEISDEDIDSVPTELGIYTGPEVAHKLLVINPNLFKHGQSGIARYGALLARKMGEFAREGRPTYVTDHLSDFSTMESVLPIQEAGAEQPEQRVMERLASRLLQRGEDPRLLEALEHGFWFGGSFMIGRYTTSREKVIANIRRHVDVSPKEAGKLLNQLAQSGAVLTEGGYSINPHVNEVQDPDLRQAVRHLLHE